MKLILIVPLMVMFCAFTVQAQNRQDDQKKDGELDPEFASMSREAGIVCGQFLPSQVPGITELMALCGGRLGFKVSDGLFFEPQFLGGAGHAQQYLIGSGSLRGDFQVSDFIISADIGADVHYATQPTLNAGVQGSETDIYFGGHVGGSIWFPVSRFFAVRTDMQFFLNPGTSLFIGAGLEFRFAPESNQGGSNSQ